MNEATRARSLQPPKPKLATNDTSRVQDAIGGVSAARAADGSDLNSSSVTVLLVEDSASDIELCRRQLRAPSGGAQTYEIETAMTLGAAIDALSTGRFDVIVLDLGLPDARGPKVVKVIRAAAPDSAILVLTTSDDVSVGAAALKNGAQDFLVKGEMSRGVLPRAVRLAVERLRSDQLALRLFHADRLASIGQLAAGVAHEVNNPSSILLANTQMSARAVEELFGEFSLVMNQGDGLPASQWDRIQAKFNELREMMTDNLIGIGQIRSTISALTTFSTLDGDDASAIDLNELVESSLGLVRNQLRHRAVIKKKLATLPKMIGHPARLSQALVNLLLNAQHALRDLPPHEAIIVVETTYSEVAGFELCVSDNGPGIPATLIERIFDPFVTTKAKGHGTGLGLALVQESARLHRGNVRVESQLGKGARFVISLPLATGISPRLRKSGAIATIQGKAKGRVLIIDDDALVAKSLARAISRRHDVVICEGAKKALSLIETDKSFDAILCDMMMPEMDGVEFYGRLTELSPKTLDRVVFLTGGAVTERSTKFLQRPELTVLVKPISYHTVLNAIQLVLDQQDQSEQ